jgi:predicted phage terminase large subunit-like protein
MADIMGKVFAAKANAIPTWSPYPGPQTEFCESEVYEVLFGGQAGPGKSHCLVALPMRWMQHRDLRVLILRRETTYLDDLVDKAHKTYKTGNEGSAKPYSAADPKCETIASPHQLIRLSKGGRIRFGHCQHDTSWEQYHGQEYHVVCFDELTQFTRNQYVRIASRIRATTKGLPRLLRATTNPGGEGHAWVFKRWGPWLDPKFSLPDWEETIARRDGSIEVVRGKGLPARTRDDGSPLPPAPGGFVLYVSQIGDREVFSTEPFTIDGADALTRTFIPARLEDNPAILQEDPNYRAKLRGLDPVARAQQEEGNWLVKASAGMFFKRAWFRVVQKAPDGCRRVRFWDYAATEVSAENTDPDWTRGVRLAFDDETQTYYVEHVASLRADPGRVDALVRATAIADGRRVAIRKAQDPASAGKREAVQFVTMLEGYDVATTNESGDKVTRARATSAQCSPDSTGSEHGRFCVVAGSWNDEFFDELEEFPDGHDDIVDALAGAHAALIDGAGTVQEYTAKQVTSRWSAVSGRGFG